MGKHFTNEQDRLKIVLMQDHKTQNFQFGFTRFYICGLHTSRYVCPGMRSTGATSTAPRTDGSPSPATWSGQPSSTRSPPGSRGCSRTATAASAKVNIKYWLVLLSLLSLWFCTTLIIQETFYILTSYNSENSIFQRKPILTASVMD